MKHLLPLLLLLLALLSCVERAEEDAPGMLRWEALPPLPDGVVALPGIRR